jgi:hypothetical protein
MNCGREATHLCTACGKHLCDSLACAARAGVHAIATNPVQAVKSAPAAAAHAVDVIANKLNPFR